MQKRINFICTLLLVSIAAGLLSICLSNDFIDGFKLGYYSVENECLQDTLSAYDRGYNAGAYIAEKVDYDYVKLVPVDFSSFTETAFNSRTGQEVSMSLRYVNVPLPENKSGWVSGIFTLTVILAGVFFIWLIFGFISNVKKGEVFIGSNICRLRWMAAVFFIWYAALYIVFYINTSFVKENFAIEGYRVVMESPSVSLLAMGFVFLLFSEIFSLGRKMKEDQEYTV